MKERYENKVVRKFLDVWEDLRSFDVLFISVSFGFMERIFLGIWGGIVMEIYYLYF